MFGEDGSHQLRLTREVSPDNQRDFLRLELFQRDFQWIRLVFNRNKDRGVHTAVSDFPLSKTQSLCGLLDPRPPILRTPSLFFPLAV